MRASSGSKRSRVCSRTSAGSAVCWPRPLSAKAATTIADALAWCLRNRDSVPNSAHSIAISADEKVASRQLLRSSQSCTQTRLVSGASVFVDHALFYGLIDHGDGLGELVFCLGLVARLQRGAELAQRSTETRCVGAILGRAGRGLAGAFQRRKVICHVA